MLALEIKFIHSVQFSGYIKKKGHQEKVYVFPHQMFYYSLQKLCLEEFQKVGKNYRRWSYFPLFILLLLLLLLKVIGDREWKDGL